MNCFSVVSLLLLSSLACAQTLPKLNHDPQALALIRCVASNDGHLYGQGMSTLTTGTLQLGNQGSIDPIRIFTSGNDKQRLEITHDGEVSARILNSGMVAIQRSTGAVTHLNQINTIAERVQHIPAMSLLADIASEHVQAEYKGPVTISGQSLVQVAAAWSDGASEEDQIELLKRTRILYSIDPTSCRIIQMEYERSAEQDTNVLFRYKVLYLNYSSLGGRAIPTTIETFTNDKLSSRLTVSSYQEQIDLSTVSFAIPAVTK